MCVALNIKKKAYVTASVRSSRETHSVTELITFFPGVWKTMKSKNHNPKCKTGSWNRILEQERELETETETKREQLGG